MVYDPAFNAFEIAVPTNISGAKGDELILSEAVGRPRGLTLKVKL